MTSDGVIRKFATDVDEPVLAEPRKSFFGRFMEALSKSRRRQADREISKHAHLIINQILGSNSICGAAANLREPLPTAPSPPHVGRLAGAGSGKLKQPPDLIYHLR